MPQYYEIKKVPYTCKQMFDLVADVEKYSEFLPWCKKVDIISRHTDFFIADLIIGNQFLNESFCSQVSLNPCQKITIQYVEGFVKSLNACWIFTPIDVDKTEIKFEIVFKIEKKTLNFPFEPLFRKSVAHIIKAFENRAKILYQPKIFNF